MISTIPYKKRSSRCTGTCYLGGLDISYDRLVALFGEPFTGKDTDEYKTDAEWHVNLIIDDEPGGFVSIYNYKNGRSYGGSSAPAVENINDWHVGGKSVMELYTLKGYIETHL